MRHTRCTTHILKRYYSSAKRGTWNENEFSGGQMKILQGKKIF